MPVPNKNSAINIKIMGQRSMGQPVRVIRICAACAGCVATWSHGAAQPAQPAQLFQISTPCHFKI